jgi:hypothetical protein
VIWITVNLLGWRAAVQGRFVDHRRWMIRSWALTLAAVTLRLYLPLVEQILDLPVPALVPRDLVPGLGPEPDALAEQRSHDPATRQPHHRGPRPFDRHRGLRQELPAQASSTGHLNA